MSPSDSRSATAVRWWCRPPAPARRVWPSRLAKLLIDARWVKRVLFLCDRKELRKQAKNAFNDFVQEPIYVIGQANDVGKMDARIYIGIYQGLINDYESFDVGFFDLIIADESHRSIYNLYGDLFKYFDALQVGLTATPVEMVSRSTCQLFGCDYKLPTANYPLEQAIADRNLVPFRVVAHTTKFLRDGIKAAHLTDEQIAQLEDQGIDPNTLDFDAKEIDDCRLQQGHQPRHPAQPDGQRHARRRRPASGQDHRLRAQHRPCPAACGAVR